MVFWWVWDMHRYFSDAFALLITIHIYNYRAVLQNVSLSWHAQQVSVTPVVYCPRQHSAIGGTTVYYSVQVNS